jgi:hypothetical protein
MYNKALSISDTCNTISSPKDEIYPHGITALVINGTHGNSWTGK